MCGKALNRFFSIVCTQVTFFLGKFTWSWDQNKFKKAQLNDVLSIFTQANIYDCVHVIKKGCWVRCNEDCVPQLQWIYNHRFLCAECWNLWHKQVWIYFAMHKKVKWSIAISNVSTRTATEIDNKYFFYTWNPCLLYKRSYPVLVR